MYKELRKFKLEELFLLGFYCFCFVLIQQQNICRRSWRSQFQSTKMPMIYLLLSFRERAAVAGSEYLTSQGKRKPHQSLRVPCKHCKPACPPGPQILRWESCESMPQHTLTGTETTSSDLGLRVHEQPVEEMLLSEQGPAMKVQVRTRGASATRKVSPALQPSRENCNLFYFTRHL